MTNELGTAVLKLKTDDSEFNKGIDRAKDKAGGLGPSLNKISNIAGGFLTADVIKSGFQKFEQFLGSSISHANEAAQTQAQLGAVIKSTGGAAGMTLPMLNAQAKALMDLTTFDDEAVASVQGLLLTFTDIKSNVFPQATQAVLDMSTALGQGLSESSIQLGKALQDPILGMTNLRRVGVILSDSQQQLVKDLVASGDKLSAQKIILAEVNKEFGGSAAAQVDTYAGRMAQLSNRVGEVKEEFGFMLQGGIMTVMDYLDAHAEDFGNFIAKWYDKLGPLVDFVETKVGAIVDTFKNMYDMIANIVDMVDSIIHGDWQSAWEDAKKIPGQLMAQLLDNLAAMFGTLPNIMISAVEAGVNGMIDVINSIPEIDLGPLGSFGGFDIGHVNLGRLDLAKTSFEDVINTIGDGATELADKAKNAQPPVTALGSAYEESGAAAKTAIGDLLQSVIGKIQGVISALFARPTIEMANMTLLSDRLQLKLDQITFKLQPSIDKLNELREKITEGAEAQKDAIQAQKDSLDAAKDLISRANEGIQNQIDAIDLQIRGYQHQTDAPRLATNATAEERYQFLMDSTIYGLERQKEGLSDQQKANEKLIKSLDNQTSALDKATKAIEAKEKADLANIDKQTKSLQTQIDTAQKNLDTSKQGQALWDDQVKIMKDLFDVVDPTLMSEAEVKEAFNLLLPKVTSLDGQLLSLAGNVKTNLIPGFEELYKAGGPLDLLDAAGRKAAEALGLIAAQKPSSQGQFIEPGPSRLNPEGPWPKIVGTNSGVHFGPGEPPEGTHQFDPLIDWPSSWQSGGYIPSPELALVGDAPGGEWILNRAQMNRITSQSQGMNVHVNVQGSILSERDIHTIVRDGIRQGGYRGVIN